MSKFGNSKKSNFLKSILTASIDSKDDKLTCKCKFNFSYMDFNQPAGQRFSDWSEDKLIKLLNKLHNYSKESLNYWQHQRIGRGNNKVLEIYGNFPKNSDFEHPKHIPHQAEWARFRIGYNERLIGFVIPKSYKDLKHCKTGYQYDCNTFYVAFLDENHKFYKK